MSVISQVIVWATVAWVIVFSNFPKSASAGPAAFSACVVSAAGPVCASAAATATASCAATAWLPPLFCTCVSALMVGACGTACVACVGALVAPTP